MVKLIFRCSICRETREKVWKGRWGYESHLRDQMPEGWREFYDQDPSYNKDPLVLCKECSDGIDEAVVADRRMFSFMLDTNTIDISWLERKRQAIRRWLLKP